MPHIYNYLKFEKQDQLRTKLQYMDDDFSFKIQNFPFLCRHILAAFAYDVWISPS